ncbi:MAG: TetR family transcriptional regulator [Micromonosporaceae bacterium]
MAWLSPIGWAQRLRPYAGERWWTLPLAVAATAALTAAAAALSARRDLGAGLLPARADGPATATAALRSPLALAWRLHRGTLIIWTACLALIGLVMGGVATRRLTLSASSAQDTGHTAHGTRETTWNGRKEPADAGRSFGWAPAGLAFRVLAFPGAPELVSGQMSENSVITESTRRQLSERQADTVRRLTDAVVHEVAATGYEALTVRNVARRAGVAPATAYTYFASKNHLLTEVFWRRLRALPALEPGSGAQDGMLADRVAGVLRELTMLVSDEPELAAACTAAMLGSDPDVRHLRLRIGAEIHERIKAAVGEESTALDALELAFTGAMVQAGMGYTTYGRMADRLAAVAALIMSSA